MQKSVTNSIDFSMPSRSVNESLARTLVSAFAMQADPTIEAISELKTVISEAVTNAIVHGYKNADGIIHIKATLYEDKTIKIVVKDKGVGISDIKRAMVPLFTTGSDERAGMGFTIMESFMDSVKVRSHPGKGTTVTMRKRFAIRAGGAV